MQGKPSKFELFELQNNSSSELFALVDVSSALDWVDRSSLLTSCTVHRWHKQTAQNTDKILACAAPLPK